MGLTYNFDLLTIDVDDKKEKILKGAKFVYGTNDYFTGAVNVTDIMYKDKKTNKDENGINNYLRSIDSLTKYNIKSIKTK